MQAADNKIPEGGVFQIMGCRLGLRQPNVNLRIKIPDAPWDKLDTIDDWLARSFRIPFVDGYATGRFPAAKTGAEAVTFRIIELANAMLRMASIPCFDKGRILSIAKDASSPGFLDVEIVTPIVEKLPLNAVASAYGLALSVFLELTRNAPANLDIEKISDALDRDMIRPWTRFMRGSTTTLAALQAASRHGVPIIHLGNSYFQLGWGSRRTILHNSSILQDSAIGSRLTDDKAVSNQILQMAGFPVPKQIPVADVQSAQSAAPLLGYPVVLKPADRNRGEGVCIDLLSERDVAAAFKKTKKLSNSIVLEEQVPGICHRMFVAGGTLLYVVVRNPLYVTGDGVHTIEELIDRENANEASLPRFWRAEPFPKDALAQKNLNRLGYAFDTILSTGSKAPLRPIESTEWGGISEDVTAITHPDNVTLALKAAEQFGLTICGVDLMSTDISVPWHQNGAKINELNYLPSIGYQLDHTRRMTESLMRMFFPDQGRIPVTLLVGGEAAMSVALERQKAMLQGGIRSHIVTDNSHLGPEGKPIPSAVKAGSLFRRTRAVLMDTQADALIMVAQTDELLLSGLPVDRLEKFEVVDTGIKVIERPNAPSVAMAIQALEELVQAHVD